MEIQQPQPGISPETKKTDDQLFQQIQELRTELLQNQDPNFRERARRLLQKIKALLFSSEKTSFSTAEPNLFGGTVRGREETAEPHSDTDGIVDPKR